MIDNHITPEIPITPSNDNFFGLDKENGKYFLACYGSLSLVLMQGDKDFLRHAVNMFCNVVSCKPHKQTRDDIISIPLCAERLKKAFSLYFYSELYKTEFAKKKYITELEEESGDNCHIDIEILNEEELNTEADRLAQSFIDNHMAIASTDVYHYYKDNFHKEETEVYISRELDEKSMALQAQMDGEDEDKLVEHLIKAAQ